MNYVGGRNWFSKSSSEVWMLQNATVLQLCARFRVASLFVKFSFFFQVPLCPAHLLLLHPRPLRVPSGLAELQWEIKQTKFSKKIICWLIYFSKGTLSTAPTTPPCPPSSAPTGSSRRSLPSSSSSDGWRCQCTRQVIRQKSFFTKILDFFVLLFNVFFVSALWIDRRKKMSLINLASKVFCELRYKI